MRAVSTVLLRAYFPTAFADRLRLLLGQVSISSALKMPGGMAQEMEVVDPAIRAVDLNFDFVLNLVPLDRFLA